MDGSVRPRPSEEGIACQADLRSPVGTGRNSRHLGWCSGRGPGDRSTVQGDRPFRIASVPEGVEKVCRPGARPVTPPEGADVYSNRGQQSRRPSGARCSERPGKARKGASHCGHSKRYRSSLGHWSSWMIRASRPAGARPCPFARVTINICPLRGHVPKGLRKSARGSRFLVTPGHARSDTCSLKGNCKRPPLRIPFGEDP
jgi:hypothetical protein